MAVSKCTYGKKKEHNGQRPPCPDPELYTWIDSKEGGFWRRKRRKGSKLNASLATRASATALLAPAVKRLRQQLEEFTRNLATGRLQSALLGLLVEAYVQEPVLNFTALKGFELQEDHPLEKLLQTNYQVSRVANTIVLMVPVDKNAIKKHNSLVTDFYFEAILVSGDPFKATGLRTDYVVSKPYSFAQPVTDVCKLELAIPKKSPWMLLLKVSCLEGNEMAPHPKHYGMKIVETGD